MIARRTGNVRKALSAFARTHRKLQPYVPVLLIVMGVLVSVATAQDFSAAHGKLYPVDEAAKDSSLAAFRDRLIQAAERRDLDFVLSVLDPEIKNSFGGDDGIEGFRRIWEPEKRDTPLWSTLLKILSMGGSFYHNEYESGFIARYVNSKWPSDFEAYDYAAITGKNVNLRDAPSAKGRVLVQLTYDIVKLEESLPDDRNPASDADGIWVKIRTKAGVTGYVSREFVYSPISHRVYLIKREGKWWIKTFVAGD